MNRFWVLLAITGLAASGCGGDGQESAPAPAPPGQGGNETLVLARVGDVEITGEDVVNHMKSSNQDEDRLKTHLHNPDIVYVALTSLVDQFVWAKVAREHGFGLTRPQEMQVRALEAEFLANRYMLEVLQEQAKPPRREVEDAYEQFKTRYQKPQRCAVRHILVESRATAERIKREADAGADFAELARAHSLDSYTKDIGGALGFLQMDNEILGIGKNNTFVQEALALEEGETGILRTTKGLHVVKVEKKEGGGYKPLDEVYEEIESSLIGRRFGEIYNPALVEARESVGVVFKNDNLSKFLNMPDSAQRLMEMARVEPEIRAKVEMYRRVAFDFSEASQAPEAQFMIGYTGLTALKDKNLARKALSRLQEKFPSSPWRKAGDYLLRRLDEDPASLGTPEEVLEAALAESD